MFIVDNTPRSEAYVATHIYHIWVEESSIQFVRGFFDRKMEFVPSSYRESFARKIRLYCEASTLRILLRKEQADATYENQVREFEKLIFPPSPTPGAMAKLDAVKAAMKELDQLLSKRKTLFWARAWFLSIGHDETNPATLSLRSEMLAVDIKSLYELLSEIASPYMFNGQQVARTERSEIRDFSKTAVQQPRIPLTLHAG